MIRKAMRYMTADALQRIVDEPRLVPDSYCDSKGQRCLIGAAYGGFNDSSSEGEVPGNPSRILFDKMGGSKGRMVLRRGADTGGLEGCFDALCARIGNGEATRLCQEAALKELHRRAVSVLAPPVAVAHD